MAMSTESQKKVDFSPPRHHRPTRLEDIDEATEQDVDETSSCGSWQDVSEMIDEKNEVQQDTSMEDDDVSRANSPEYICLREAIISGDIEDVKLRFEYDTNLEGKFGDGNTPLVLAITKARVDVVKFLLEKGADVHRRCHRLPPLIQAVLAPDREPELIQLLLDHGASLTVTTYDQLNALHWAVMSGRTETVELLISKGMDIEKTCSKGRNPLILAAEKGWTCVAKVLLAKGAELNVRSASGGTPLIWSACNNWIQTVKFWIEQGVDVNARDNNGLTALSLACHFGCLEVAETLLAHGADVNAVSDKPKNFTALMAAACANCPTIVKRLIAAGADLYMKNGSDETALDAALAEKSQFAFEVLIEAMGGEDYPMQSVSLNFALADGHKMVASLKQTASIMYQFIGEKKETPGRYAWLDWVLNQGGDLVKPAAMYKLLHAALEEQNAGLLKALAEHGCDVNTRLESGHTPLSFAVGHRNLSMIRTLLDAGADPNVSHPDRDNLNYTAFDDAIIDLKNGDNTELVDLLLKSGRCKINKGKDPSNTAFSYVLGKVNEWPEGVADELAVRMINSIEDVNEDRDALGCTLLHVAVAHEREDFIDMLLDKGADIHAGNGNGYTPFILACQRSADMIDVLLKRGAKVDATYSRGATAIHAAAACGNVEALELLLKKPLDVNAKTNDGQSALQCALGWEKEETALVLIEAGANLQWQTAEKQTPLHLAVKHHMEHTVEKILKQDVDVNARDENGWTPLHEACAVGSPLMIDLLLEAGADIEAALPDGDRPLHVALTNDHETTTRHLIDNGADITARGSKNRTPLHFAALYGLSRIVHYFLETGVSTEDIDDETWTPLCCAENAFIAQLLINKGAEVDYKDKDMWTPLHQAVLASDARSVKCLLLAGADEQIRTTDDYLTVRERVEELEDEDERDEMLDLLDNVEFRGLEKESDVENEGEDSTEDAEELGEKFEEL